MTKHKEFGQMCLLYLSFYKTKTFHNSSKKLLQCEESLKETSNVSSRVVHFLLVYLFLVHFSGGGVFASAVVCWAEGTDAASVGAILSLPHPPGQLIAPQ